MLLPSPTHRHQPIMEHRLVMEAELGRFLTRDEVVHHINEIPTDNRPENLAVMTKAEHDRLHSANRKGKPRTHAATPKSNTS